MLTLSINGTEFWTVRDSLNTTWRGGKSSPFASGRTWDCEVACISIAEVDTLTTLINTGVVSVILPNGVTCNALINRNEHDPFANTFTVALQIEEII
jgi:hypothetical protein